MKRIGAVLLLVLLLAGCSGQDDKMDQFLSLRDRVLDSDGCSFDTVITADYGDKLYTFSVSCKADREGNLSFTVLEPETIAGITGTVSKEQGNLTFDGTALAFGLLADDQLNPVSAPWIFLHTLRGGYVTACGEEGELLRVSVDDSYADDALNLQIWLDAGGMPVQAEIAYRDRRILSLAVTNFELV